MDHTSLKGKVDVFYSMLLAIYDGIAITDSQGNILEKIGEMEGFWEVDTDSIIGKNLFELEKDTFFGESSIKDLINSYQKSDTLTSWHGKVILVTCHEVQEQHLFAWGFKKITEENILAERDYPSSETDQELPNNITVPFIAHSKKMKDVLHTVEMVSKVSSTVLLLGESGVGKEVVAKTIHELGSRHSKPFVAVNCGAIPEPLLESELFGYEDGAFSGAKKNGAPGKFEIANHGILFLDEIGEMPLNLQVKLLRALQEREITPVGGSTPIKLNIQVIAATNKSLLQMVGKGEFREDLYYRLNVVPIEIPSLRERVEEIPYLVYHFTQKFNQLHNRAVTISPDAIDVFSIYNWPGNIRQLENMIERLVVTSRTEEIDAHTVHQLIPKGKDTVKALPMFEHLMPLNEAMEHVEDQLITMAMEQYKSIKLAAKVLDISQPTMSRKYKKIRDKIAQANLSPTTKRRVLEDQLDKRLRSIAIVTAAIIQPEEVIALKNNISAENPAFQKLRGQLTMIRKQEGIIQWVFLFAVQPNGEIIHLVSDEDFVMEPGEVYECPPEMMKAIEAAKKGNIEVTPLYQDVYGQWKTSFAPIVDHLGNFIALIGYDYSKAYVELEMKKLKTTLLAY